MAAWSVSPAVAAPCQRQSLGGQESWHALRIGEPEWSAKKYVDLGDGKRTLATYVETSKGNGTIRIKNLELRAYRAHAGEGFTYSPYAFTVELSTKSGSSVCTLFVSGKIVTLDDNGERVSERPVKLVYEYDAKRGAFRRVETHTPVPIDDIELSLAK
ncbi:MAG TPA: hypothetical protein VLV55_02295 [Rhizomicrobium sp.]|nr:hypothetical protein [Rhizomicrobium sp.]